MSDLHIREAQAADQANIHTVTLAAYQEYAAQVPPPFWEGYRQNIEHSLMNTGAAEQLVAEQDGALVGTVMLIPAGAPARARTSEHDTLPYPEIRLLAVAPEGRGHGVGAALVRECLRRARVAGASAITLHTTDYMQVAQAMYVRMGFQRAPELDFHPAPEITVKGYRLALA